MAVATRSDTPGDGELSATYTRGFTITNLSSHPLKLLSVAGNTHQEDGVPTIGSTVEPGFSTRFEVTWLYGAYRDIKAQFAVLDAQGTPIGTYHATMKVFQTNPVGPSIASEAAISPGLGEVQAGRDQLTVLDMPGTVVDVPAGQGQQQAEILDRFCAGNPSATCTFVPTGRDKNAYTGMHPAKGIVYNNTPLEQFDQYTWTDTASVTHSVELSASVQATLLKIVEVSLSATYGHTWTQEHQFSISQTLNLPAYHKGWLDVRDPVVRDTGDFTVTLGNTTWKLHGVSFDSPDLTRPVIYVKQAVPMTPEDLVKYKPGNGFDPDVQATEGDRTAAVGLS
ncbi:hypothetical protein TOK_1917 [Pseudonocardia sp. N23]|nr:hypothetical protein TOK_1917 [Pseudonocardia sp. N23]